MRISIIVATYNAANFLPRLLDSIVLQSFKAREVIVIDGGSTDASSAVLDSYKGILALKYISEPDKGIYDAWNKGLGLASGEWVAFLGADDEFSYVRALDDLYDCINQFPLANLIASLGNLVNWNDRRPIKVVGQAWDSSIKIKMTLCHPGLLHKRSLFDEARFDIKWRICGDYEFLLRCASEIYPAFLNKSTVNIGDGGVSRQDVNKVLRETMYIQSSSLHIGPILSRVYYYWARFKNFVKKLFALHRD